MRRPRRNHTKKFKAQVALAALKGDKTLAALASQFEIHQNQIVEWKQQLLAHAPEAFGAKHASTGPDLKDFHAKIGQITLENDFLESARIKAGKLSARR